LADNTTLDPGTGGDTIATDDVSGIKYQRVKLVNGTLDATDAIPGDASNGLDVDVTRSALPTGASTAAKQPALGTAGSASADVLSVQGIASMTALKVDGSAVTQPVSGTVTATGPLTDTQLRASAVPVSLASAPSTAVTNAGTFAVQDSEKIADNAGFTDGTTKVNPVGYILDETPGTALTENDIAAARVDSKRAQVLTLEDATTRGQRAAISAAGRLSVDASGVAVPVTDNSGSLTVDAPVGTPVFSTPTPSTTGGWSKIKYAAQTTTKQAVKASAGTFGGYYIYNPNATVAYLQVFDVASASVTLGTTVPDMIFAIPAASAANIEITCGVNMATAITLACTTTATGLTAPTTGLDMTIFYK
jgi:hypothetical protein